MEDAILTINAHFGTEASKEVEGIENKLRASIRGVLQNNWMSTNEEGLLRASLAGVLLDVGVESVDGKRILLSVEMLKKFTAALNAGVAGVSVDMAKLIEEVKEHEAELIPISKIFCEEKAKWKK